LLFRLSFAAPFVYSVRGATAVSVRSRQLRDRIKRGDQVLMEQIADHVADLVAQDAFPGFFGPDVTLVPVPSHAPAAPGAVGTTARIAVALYERGLAAGIAPVLERTTLVAKSAFSAPAQRPRAQEHYDSLTVRTGLAGIARVLLVDDFVTRGATLIGAASRVCADHGGLAVKAFALVRSMTEGDVATIRYPCTGSIEMLANGETQRVP
jgi:hypothetical protein